MTESEGNSIAVEANIDDESGPAGDLASSPVTIKQFLRSAKNLKAVVDQLYRHANQIPNEWRSDPRIEQGLELMKLAKQALDEFIRFLESPLGVSSVAFLWKHTKYISTFADIGAQVIIASAIVHIFQKFLDVRENEFQPPISRVNMCMDRVGEMLPEIKDEVQSAADTLKQLGGSSLDEITLENTVWLFENHIASAKQSIVDSKGLLETASSKISECMLKITGKMWIYDVARGFLFGGMCIALFSLARSGTVPKRYGFAFSITCGVVIFGPVPRYRKISDDLNKYMETQEQLMHDMNNFEKRLEDDYQKYSKMQPKK